jgi:hypothetical protein
MRLRSLPSVSSARASGRLTAGQRLAAIRFHSSAEVKAPDFTRPGAAIFLFGAALLSRLGFFLETFLPETFFLEILLLADFLAIG